MMSIFCTHLSVKIEKGKQGQELTTRAQGPMQKYERKKKKTFALHMYLRLRSYFTDEPGQREYKLKQKVHDYTFYMPRRLKVDPTLHHHSPF